MNPEFLVDTDVMVDFLRGDSKAVDFIKNAADRVALSVIVCAELYSGARDEKDRHALDGLLEHFSIFPVQADIARDGGLLRKQYGKSHGVGLADALIAATAIHYGLDLKTCNVRHFPMFPALKPAYPKRTA